MKPAGGGSWTPALITTVVWFDVSDTSTAMIVDGKVSQRADKSGNNRHAAQASSANRPIAGTSKDDYDGIDDRLIMPNTSALNAPAYIAVVCKLNVTAQYHGIVDKRGNSAGWMLETGPTATAGRPRLTATTSGLVAPTSVHNSLTIVEAQMSGANSFVGTPAGVTTGTLPTPSTVSENITIGGQGGRTAALDMDFHEMLILAEAPDLELRYKIQGYFAHKWDAILGGSLLRDSLPLGHPYKSSAP